MNVTLLINEKQIQSYVLYCYTILFYCDVYLRQIEFSEHMYFDTKSFNKTSS